MNVAKGEVPWKGVSNVEAAVRKCWGKRGTALMLPINRYYRCDSARVKKMWLDEFERAKRDILHEGILVRQSTIRGKRMSVQVGWV